MAIGERVAIVTGSGGTGCGRAIARRFARDGAAVVVSDVNEAGGRETLRLIERDGGRAVFHRADVRGDAQCRALVDAAVRTFGRLTILVNNASAPHPTADGIAGWTDAIETDLLGAIHMTRWAIEAMRDGGGSIVNISSISALWHGRTTPGGFPGYDVAKAGVIRMTTGLARDAGVRINCLAPGWIDTEGPRDYWASLTPDERAARGVPSRLLPPDDVAEMVARIADDAALNGRMVVWWSDDRPRLVAWGDRGYREYTNF